MMSSHQLNHGLARVIDDNYLLDQNENDGSQWTDEFTRLIVGSNFSQLVNIGTLCTQATDTYVYENLWTTFINANRIDQFPFVNLEDYVEMQHMNADQATLL